MVSKKHNYIIIIHSWISYSSYHYVTKSSYKHIEECTWHQNAKLTAKISNKTLISAKFYIVQWFMVYPNCNDLMVGIHAPWVCFLYG